jgi:hypothetical protein
MRKFLLLAVGGVVLLGLGIVMTSEQRARSASQEAHESLAKVIEEGGTLTHEQVHERLGRDPDESRQPARHRLVEEYRWEGGLETHTVYVYYTTAAAKLLTAVSINQQIAEMEGDQ